MHFLFDLDETLVKGDIIKTVSLDMYFKGELYRVYSGRDISSYNLTGLPENLKEKVLDAFINPKFVYLKQVINEAYNFLCCLQLYGHSISILTSRSLSIQKETIDFINTKFPRINFLNVEFCTNSSITADARISKKEKLLHLKPDFYFDDAIHYCNESANLGIETYLISNNYTGWNWNRYDLDYRVNIIKHIGMFNWRRL